MKSSPAKSPVKRTPSAAAEDDSTTVYDVIEVPDLDLSMEEWYMLDRKLKPGQVIRISVTVRNLGQRAVNERLSIRVERDAFFQANNVPLPVSSIPAYGEAKVNITLKVQAVRNLDKLPPSKELMLVKDAGPGKLHKVSSISIVIPIDPFIRHLKEEFKAIKVQLWGLFGTGKSSFINSIATLFNEDPRFPDQKLSPAYSAPSGGTVTLKIKPYKFNNVTLVDTWGWEEQRKELYSDLLFQLMLGGCLGSDFDMDKGKSINVLELPKLKQGGGEPVDLLLFFITVEAVDNDAYVEQMNRFIGEARKLKKPFLVLLTQIDRIDPSLRDEPYCNSPTVRSLATKVALKAGLNEGLVQPVVNYTFESERTWAMDRAAFVTLYKAFLTCETTDW